MSKIGELLNKEITNISMDGLSTLWEETVNDLTESWHDQLVREITARLLDLDFHKHTDFYYEEELGFKKDDIICVISVSHPDPYDGNLDFELDGYIEKEVSPTTTLSYDISAKTITELMMQIQMKMDSLEQENLTEEAWRAE
jgi:hypothetical protein